MRANSVATVVRWTARILGTLLLILIAAFAIGEGVPNLSQTERSSGLTKPATVKWQSATLWARVKVAEDKIKEKVDSILGTMDVKRKEIELAVNGLKEGIDGLRRAKIKAQVSEEQIQRQARPQEDRLAQMDEALKTLRGHLETAQPVEIAGKTYTPEGLKRMADRVLEARKTCSQQLEGLHDAQVRLQKVVSTLERKQREAESRLTAVEGQIAAIDANRIALTAMQQSAQVMGEDDGNLAKSLDRLQTKVNDLFADVEAELRFQDEKWAETETATKEIDLVEAVVGRLQKPPDTVVEIDRILGKR